MLYDVVVVGAGISGATIADCYARLRNKKVLVLEQRDHIAGNCYDYTDEKTGVRVSKYGAHLFHTNDEEVWKYVNRFSDWEPYVHRVVALVDGKIVPVPVNLHTVNQLLGLSLKDETMMREWLAQFAREGVASNGEEAALRRVGPELYEKIFKHYTKKQWDLWPHELDASVLERIPVRTNEDDRYFSDKYQALPSDGYSAFLGKMLEHPNITVMLETPFESMRDKIDGYQHLFFTGPIDQFFRYKFNEKLQYRSLRFEFEQHDVPYYQQHSVVNYPSADVPFTRIVEYKHFTGQTGPATTISKEFPTWEGEPYYPVPNQRNRDVYSLYQREAERLGGNVHFVGRLASYKYFNMDQAFKNALDLFRKIEACGSEDLC